MLCVDILYSLFLMLLFYIAEASGSIKMENREGESGHPCLVHQWSVKRCDVTSFVTTVALSDVYSIFIQWMNNSPKPNLLKVQNRNVQFTLTNAFSASNVLIIFVNNTN